MRRLMVGCGAAVALLLGAGPAGAGPATGSTELIGTAVGGQEVLVEVTLSGVYPVVPYEFHLENRCWFSGRFKGPVDSTETYPLLGPWFDAGGASYSEEIVDLADVPAGAACRVSITRGSSPVKGSTTSYLVGP